MDLMVKSNNDTWPKCIVPNCDREGVVCRTISLSWTLGYDQAEAWYCKECIPDLINARFGVSKHGANMVIDEYHKIDMRSAGKPNG